ncbi:hypothetical protein D3C75_960230 [compost metagenome]
MVLERFGHAGDNLGVERTLHTLAPGQLAIIQPGFLGVARQAKTGHGMHVFVQQAVFQQFAYHQGDAARGLELVDVRRAVRVDTT